MAAGRARLLGADRREVEAAVALVTLVLGHDVLTAARQAHAQDRCHREAPVTRTVEGQLVEGVVDLAFETADGFVVVDFKTDRAEEARPSSSIVSRWASTPTRSRRRRAARRRPCCCRIWIGRRAQPLLFEDRLAASSAPIR